MQEGQVFELKTRGVDGSSVWAYRYRTGGSGSRRPQRGGFASERDAAEALQRALKRLRRQNGLGGTLTLEELVNDYLAQHEAEPETIDKLRWLLTKALGAVGGRRLSELRSQEIAAWRMTISPGHRFERPHRARPLPRSNDRRRFTSTRRRLVQLQRRARVSPRCRLDVATGEFSRALRKGAVLLDTRLTHTLQTAPVKGLRRDHIIGSPAED